MTTHAIAAPAASLSDRYTVTRGVIFMSGNQALVRLPLQQRRRDLLAGHKTGGFISGYRGSPLGRLDMELWQSADLLRGLDIHFQPGVNEDLAATALWGAQYVPILPGGRVDGVFGLWYGKGPGVDRSGDVLKHANAAGTSPLGGVLALAGDDHAAKSSTQAHQSEQAFIAAGIPVLYPSTVQEILDYGLMGIAMSRHAGCWVAMKLVTDVVEGSSTVVVEEDRPRIVVPEDPEGERGARYIKRYQPPLQQEAQLYNVRLPAAVAFARANGINRIAGAEADARIGIVSAGKSWTDTELALQRLESQGLAVPRSQLRLLKVGMVWPLEPEIVTRFARGLERILVIEEKRPLLEDQVKAILFAVAGARPQVVGKFRGGVPGSAGALQPFIPQVGELSPTMLAGLIAEWLGLPPAAASEPAAPVAAAPAVERPPTFCSGCPHSTSTRVPDGSLALAGIGCHSIALLLDPLRTGPLSHMGAEGVMWVGQAPFSEHRHVFANIGDGTYYHSGFLAIRQAIAAKVSITYKLLLNGFVSMTGGQPIEGELTPRQLATELLAEGVAKVVVVTDDPDKYARQALPAGVGVRHRDDMDAVQRELREQQGVSVLVYDQMCATERRRQRKRGKLPDPDRRSFINSAVCEGCGDCGVQSNCLSIEPLPTELGRKRRINQASCNKDFSCTKGFCPSFVTVQGGRLRAGAGARVQRPSPHDVALPDPSPARLDEPLGVIVTGVGGTGVITVGAILTMAAHLDGLHASSLDLTGLAQKYGAVMSHIRLTRPGAGDASYRLGAGEANLVLGCDLIVTAGAEAVERMHRRKTRVVLNTDLSPTREFARNADWAPDVQALQRRVEEAALCVEAMSATTMAQDLMGDPVAANLFMLGFAWQRGWVPVSGASIEQAIRLNGVAVEANLDSFAWGRVAADAPQALQAARERSTARRANVVALPAPALHKLDDIARHRSEALTRYQNAAYARRYQALVQRVARAEASAMGGDRLARAVARYYFKLLAYKDEFEVARLYACDEFAQELARTFEGDFTLHFHLGAGPFARRDPNGGPPRKTEAGPWVMTAMRLLAPLRVVRGTWLDPFRHTPERRAALAALAEYEADIGRLVAEFDPGRIDVAVEIASLPETLRGYGHVRAEHARRNAQRREALWQQWSLQQHAAA